MIGSDSRRGHSAAAILMATTAFTSLGMMATQAAAADNNDTNSKAATIGEVVVTAGKRTQNIQKVPSSVTAVGDALINRVQANSLNDVAAYVPGLNVQSSRIDANRLVVRGLSTGPNDLSPTVGVYVDDAPFGSNSGLALGALFSPDVDPFDLDRIEVLRGPQGTLYGASTLGGLVKYVTKSPDAHAFSAHARVDWGDDSDADAENYAFRAGVNLPIIQDKVAVRLSGFYAHSDGDTTNVRTGQTGLNALTKRGGRIDLMLRPTEDLTVDLIAMTDRSNQPHVGVVDGNAATLQPIHGQYAGYDYVDGYARSNYDVYQANIRYQLANGVTVTSTTGYSKFKVRELVDFTTTFAPALGALGSLFEFSGPVSPATNKFTEELRIASPTGDKFEWLAGFFYDKEDSNYISGINSTYLFGATPPPALSSTVASLANYLSGSLKEHYKEYAGFANGTYNITPDLSVGAGVRYSHNNQHSLSTASGFLTLIGVVPTLAKGASSDNVWTESFDAKWQYAAHSMVYVRAANGYRPGGPVPGGAPFGPDRTWNYEAGLKTSALDGKLTADLAVFYIDWSKIQLNFFNGSHITTGNAGDARSKGVEFEGVYSPIQGLTISANAAYTDAVITKLLPGATGGAAVGDPLPFNSKWTGALRVDYYFPLSGTVTANVGGGLRYKDSFNTTFPGDTGTRFYKLPSTLFTDLRAGLSFDDRLDVSFQILNVANVRKLSNALESLAVPAATADALGQPVQLTYTPGRTFGLSISAKF